MEWRRAHQNLQHDLLGPSLSKLDLSGDGPATPHDLRQLHLFKDVEDDVLAAVLPMLRQTTLKPRATIALADTYSGHIGFAWSGDFRFCATAPTGETVTLYTVRPREAFGYAMALIGMRFGDVQRLVADRTGLVLDAPAEAILELGARSPAFAKNLTDALARLSLSYGARVYELACASVRTRIQAELLRYAALMNDPSDRLTLDPSPTHLALAALVGAAREPVSRSLSLLREDGLIEIARGKITITSVRALRLLDEQALGVRYTMRPHAS